MELLIRERVVLRSTLVWKQGLSRWTEADQTELDGCFDTPPELKTVRPDPSSTADFGAVPEVPAVKPTPDEPRLQAEAEPLRSDAGFGAPTTPSSSDSLRRSYDIGSGVPKPLSGMIKHANVVIVFFVLASAIVIVADLSLGVFISQILEGSFASEAELNSQAANVDAFAQGSNIAFLLIFAWSIIVIGRWTYRAMKNLREMGYETTVSPGWAVGWHFVPIALLWMPFRGMAQIWRGSVHGAPTGDANLPGAMRMRWATWLVGNWLSYGGFQMQEAGLTGDDLEVVQIALGIGVVGSGLHIVSAILLLGLMKQVTNAQENQPALEFQ